MSPATNPLRKKSLSLSYHHAASTKNGYPMSVAIHIDAISCKGPNISIWYRGLHYAEILPP
jgi:hypothetical protein